MHVNTSESVHNRCSDNVIYESSCEKQVEGELLRMEDWLGHVCHMGSRTYRVLAVWGVGCNTFKAYFYWLLISLPGKELGLGK